MSIDTASLMVRLNQSEDPWTERKESFDEREVRKTLVAFANSVRDGEVAVLFLGARNDGNHPGLLDADDTQKKVAGIANRCYPPVQYQTEVFYTKVGKKQVEILAVKIPFSVSRPHFAGTAYIRKGSESIECPREIFQELIASQNDKARRILQYKEKPVTIRFRSPSGFNYDRQGSVRFCDAHSVTIQDGSGFLWTSPISDVQIEKDGMDRFVITIPPQCTEEEHIRHIVRLWTSSWRSEGDRLFIDKKNHLASQILANAEKTVAAVAAESDEKKNLRAKVLLAHVKFELKKIRSPRSREEKIRFLNKAVKNARTAFATPQNIRTTEVEAVAEVATSFEEIQEFLLHMSRGDQKVLASQMQQVIRHLGLGDLFTAQTF
jgi:hypothetical protein